MEVYSRMSYYDANDYDVTCLSNFLMYDNVAVFTLHRSSDIVLIVILF